MGKGPEYIALFYMLRRRITLAGLFTIVLLTTTCKQVYAQEPEGTTTLTHSDTGIYQRDITNNGLVKKDTVTQSITAMDSSSTDSANAAKAKKMPLHSARKAAYLSAVLPGLGQAYNKKYWKIPIIYAGLGGCAYALYYTAFNFNGYRAVDRAQKALVPNPNASFNGVSDPATVQTYQAYYKKYLDIAAIGCGVFYMLNVIDATVDAHLMGWNMKDDLSVSWTPTLLTSPNYNSAAAGLIVTLHF
jgi:hypothetical protein